MPRLTPDNSQDTHKLRDVRNPKKTPNVAPKAPAGQPSEVVEHEGASEDEIGDRTGPAVGYDEEPEQVKDRGGVS